MCMMMEMLTCHGNYITKSLHTFLGWWVSLCEWVGPSLCVHQ